MVDHFDIQARIAGLCLLLLAIGIISQLGTGSTSLKDQPAWRRNTFYFCAFSVLVLTIIASFEYWHFEYTNTKGLIFDGYRLLRKGSKAFGKSRK